MKATLQVGSAIVAVAMLLTNTASNAQGPSLIPGSIAPMTFSLSYTQETPGTFKRDGTGKVVLVDRKKIPAFENNWQVYDSNKKTLTTGSDFWVKSTKFKYSNRELLNDLIRLGFMAAPVTGWSIVSVNVESQIVDSEGEFTDSFFGSTKYYAVKAGVAAVAVPLSLLQTEPYVLNQKSISSRVYKNVSDPNWDSEDSENWTWVSGHDSGSFSYRQGVKGMLLMPDTLPDSIPSWWETIFSYRETTVGPILGSDTTTSYRKKNSLEFNGVVDSSMPNYGKFHRILNQSCYVTLAPSQKISNILGKGPTEFLTLENFGNVEFPAILEGSITIAKGKAGNVASYPNVLDPE